MQKKIISEITLGIPLYNSSQYLEKLILSINNQSYLPREIIFIDDKSNDDTYAILKNQIHNLSDCGGFIRIRVLKNTNNLGIAGNYNKIVNLATTKWVHILDADDYLCEDYYKILSRNLDDKYSCVIGGMIPSIKYVNWYCVLLSIFIPKRKPRCIPILGSVTTRSSIIYNRNLLLKNPFPSPQYECSDIINLLEVSEHAECIFEKKAKIYYRIRNNSATNNNTDEYIIKLKEYSFLIRIFHLFDLFLRKKVFCFLRKLGKA